MAIQAQSCICATTSRPYGFGPFLGPGFGPGFGPGLGHGISARVQCAHASTVDLLLPSLGKKGNRPTSSASISVPTYVNILAQGDLGLRTYVVAIRIRHAVRIRILAWSCNLTKVGKGVVSRQLLMDVSPQVP